MHIVLYLKDNLHYTFNGSDSFNSLNLLNKHLEEHGSKLLCNGARIDVYPSGMSRNMGGGVQAYITKLGEHADDLVNIFDYAEPKLVGTVEAQELFHQKWLGSINGLTR